MGLVDANKPLPLVSYESIATQPLPPVDWLVEGVIANGDRVVVYGEQGSFKSWLLPHLALNLAAGRPWLDKFPVPKARSVLYIDEEMSERTFRRRVNRLGLGLGSLPNDIAFRVASRVGVTFDAAGVKALLSALKHTGFHPEVVIVETLRRVLRGSENEAKDVGEFWRAVGPLLADRTLIISHHMRKPSQQGPDHARYRASGSTDILAGADTTFAVTKRAQDAVGIECTKARAAEEVSPFMVSLYDEGPDSPVVIKYEGAWDHSHKQNGKLDNAITVTQAFLLAAPEHRATAAAIHAHLGQHGVKKRTAEAALAVMVKQGIVVRPAQGEYQWVGATGAK
jgi:hypothetical protein